MGGDDDDDDDDEPVSSSAPLKIEEPKGEPKPDSVGVAQPAPVLPTTDEVKAAARSRSFDTDRFTLTITAPWVEAPGAYRTDYGALLTILPDQDATGRAIDIYREAVVVPPELHAKVHQRMVEALTQPETGRPSLVVTLQPPAMIGDHQVRLARVTNPATPDRVLQYLWWFSDDGVYTFVLSSRTAVVDEDRSVLDQAVGSIRFKDLAAVRQAVRNRLPFAFGRPENWLLSVRGQVATLRAPLQAGPDGELAKVQTTISVTTIGKTFPTEDGAVRFARQLGAELAPAGTPPKEREQVGPKPVMGQVAGLRSAQIDCAPPNGDLEEGSSRRIIVVFGRRQTFVVALNYADHASTSALAGLGAFMDRFSEAG